jgi:energy-coupling factor transporter ATP-binding protein EcfA2
VGKLAEWSRDKSDWVKDALQRAASSLQINQEDIDAVVSRVAIAHGLSVEGDHPCLAFSEASLIDVDTAPDDVVLCSVGPLQGLDRLVADQVLQFALDGITVIFGDNGAGKSGYTRALRQLTCVRQNAILAGDVFASTSQPEKSITYTYRREGQEALSETWREGAPKPTALAGITLLDTDNLRVYVDGKNDILYMPPEATCVGRMAELYQAAAMRFTNEIAAAKKQCASPFGGAYKTGSSAAGLVAKLALSTSESDLPTEEELRQHAIWTDEHLAELARLRAELSQGPGAQAALCDRIASACETASTPIDTSKAALSDAVLAGDAALLEAKATKRRAADALVAEQIGSQPIDATGSDVWQSLFRIARQFAAEAGLRGLDEAFIEGDACPLCQQTLREGAAKRLAAFDTYVEGSAVREAEKAENAVAQRLQTLRSLTFKSAEELQSLLGEASTQGPEAEALVRDAIAYSGGLKARRDERLAQFEASQLADLAPLPDSALERLKLWSSQLRDHAKALRGSDDQTAATTTRIIELEGQQQMSGQIEEFIARRHQLVAIHRWKKCETALNTRPLSLLMTSLRKELTTPALETRINEEIANFGMDHVPLRFADETAHGASFFEVGLATDQAAKKARILSEGEQRALSLACFMAETHVAERKSGIILDDPVTSLDHTRIRRVARRLIDEAGKGRQIIIFTHNLVFYHELMLACTDRPNPVSALPCLIEQGGEAEFGLVSVDSAPWLARKVKDREHTLKGLIDSVPAELATTSDEYRRACTGFYAALRETWERAIEEIVLNDVVRRFGANVGTLRLGGVDVSDEDYAMVHRAMSRSSEHSGHDQAAARQIESPTKKQMQADLNELTEFRAKKAKSNQAVASRRRAQAENPPKAATA